MDRYHCNGWLHLDVQEDSLVIIVRLKHQCSHPPYTDISLPLHWKKYVEDNLHQTPGNVSSIFLLYISLLIFIT